MAKEIENEGPSLQFYQEYLLNQLKMDQNLGIRIETMQLWNSRILERIIE